MKNLFTLCFLSFFLVSLTAQTKSKLFFNEFSIAITRATSSNAKGIGFGLGAYHTFGTPKKLNIVLGLEANMTNFFTKGEVKYGLPVYYTDVSTRITTLTIPAMVALSPFKNRKAFLTLGVKYDPLILGQQKSTHNRALYDQAQQQIVGYNASSFKYTALTFGGFGLISGLGYRMSLKNRNLLIKLDYRLAFKNQKYQLIEFNNNYLRLSCGIQI